MLLTFHGMLLGKCSFSLYWPSVFSDNKSDKEETKSYKKDSIIGNTEQIEPVGRKKAKSVGSGGEWPEICIPVRVHQGIGKEMGTISNPSTND